MERLTEWIGEGEERQAVPRMELRNNGHKKCCNKLAELEDLEEQGLLLKLPCKKGTTVYDIKWWDDKEEKVKVDGKFYYRRIRKYKVTKSTFSLYDFDQFGKTVFLTKEEAEAKLKEMQNE